jgi:hypothetical protein
MTPFTITITTTIEVRPEGADKSASAQKRPAEPLVARNCSADKSAPRGRPSLAPDIIALIPKLVKFHGSRLVLDDVVRAAVSEGVVGPAEPHTTTWANRRHRIKEHLRGATLPEGVEIVGVTNAKLSGVDDGASED